MLKIILQDLRHIYPFNERARDLRIQNKPLWLVQRDVLAPHTHRELELPPQAAFPKIDEECLVYRDNLFFDSAYFEAFLGEARLRHQPCQAAFSANDPSFASTPCHYPRLTRSMGTCTWQICGIFPNGIHSEIDPMSAEPVVIDLDTTEAGYYHVPTYMAYEQGDLTFQVPRRSLIAIDSWVHIFIADIVLGSSPVGRVLKNA
jgi:UDP-N-acetylglucosamine diphosphorylase / glucose-1-phosphate thymidylyltransferase / UDP-N-acetylgalactosamine diphosphorylase / glucosamine-1-phosphate N-acetyltransferase / galactosamine-1-phosphate N-acetyltransferase